MIKQSELVESIFGYWPTFDDAKIVNFGWDTSGVIEMSIYYIDATQNKDALIALRFTGATEIELAHFMSENVIDCLRISPGEPVLVDLQGCVGLDGTFKCSGVEVLHVGPNNSSKPTPLRGAA
ncbi:Imm50 family immunity protein [Lysobacter sp. HA35]